ncbi:MAG: TIGR02186 family protein [Bauldia sp.]
MRRWLALAAFAGMAAPAHAADEIAIALSANEVRIESNFTGTGITVFGAITSDQPAIIGTDVDLVVVLEGPPATVVARRKDPVLGLWINRGEATFLNVPEFYAIHTTGPLGEISEPSVLRSFRLGIANLPLVTTMGWGALPFQAAVIRLKEDEGHFLERTDAIENPGASIFRTTFELPADIPIGEYQVSVLLFRNGAMTASAEETLVTTKSGAEQFLFDASQNAAIPYALAVVVMGLFIGWLAGAIFRRD